MKFSTPTLLAILATSAVVSSAPTAVSGEGASESTQLVRKSDVSNALALIEELGSLKQKRDLIEDEAELTQLSKRADSLLSELITALTNSGIIGDVWDALTKDTALRSELASLVKSAVSTAITQGPALIKAVYNSGLIQKLFKAVYNDSSLRSTLLSVAKTLFGSGLNLLKAFLATKKSSTTTTAATAAATTAAAAKRELANVNLEEFIDKRDLASTVTTVVTAIKNTGIVQSLVKKVLADPSASIAFLTKVLKNGVVAGEAIFSWAKSSGILKTGLNWIAEHGGTYTSEVATFLGSLIADGTASTSDVDNASTIASTAATTIATTATSTATTLVKRRMY